MQSSVLDRFLVFFILLDFLEPKNVLSEVLSCDLCKQRFLLRRFPCKLREDVLHFQVFDLLALHLKHLYQRLPFEALHVSLRLAECCERLLYVVLAYSVHRTVVYEQPNELIKSNVGRSFSFLGKELESNFIDHILLLLLCRVVAHGAHEVRDLLDWHFRIQLASLRGVFLLRSNHRVIEEIVHILESLTLSAAFNKVYEWLDARST